MASSTLTGPPNSDTGEDLPAAKLALRPAFRRQRTPRSRVALRAGRRRLALLSWLLIVALLVAACGSDEPEAPTEGDLGAVDKVVSLSGKGLGLEGGIDLSAAVLDRVEELPASIEEYIDAYQAEFQLAPRQGDSPLEIAEAYMRRYQPGPLPRVFQHTVLYDRHGTLLAELVEEGRRAWMPLSRISPYLINATIATEDATFYENKGIDARRVIGALIQNASSGDVVSGASTITMQLARNLFFPPSRRYDQSMDRKVFEMLIAQDLTNLYTKNELLEMYLNLINYGQRAYGAEAAAYTYFGKTAADLTLAEATLIAGIPQQPAGLDPLKNFDAAKARQRTVLDLMVRHKMISPEEADATYAQEVPVLDNTYIEAPRAAPFCTVRQGRAGRPHVDRQHCARGAAYYHHAGPANAGDGADDRARKGRQPALRLQPEQRRAGGFAPGRCPNPCHGGQRRL